MRKTRKRTAVEGDAVDRLTTLPINVIDLIIEKMPIRDAVKTSILSSRWRHIWAHNPCLVFDVKFSREIKRNRLPTQFQFEFARIVNRILLQHFGPIRKFVINISDVSSDGYSDVDLWMLFLSKKSVNELILENSEPFGHRYKLPSYTFLFSELSLLDISSCIFKPPRTFEGFSKLQELRFLRTTLESCVLKVPLLTYLTLEKCRCIGDVQIHAPILQELFHSESDDLEISSFMICKDITYAYIYLKDGVEHQREGEKINLTKLLGCWPRIEELETNGFAIKNLTEDTVPESLPTILHHLTHLSLFDIRFDLDQIAWILCLLRSSPLLSNFEIWTYSSVTYASVSTNTEVLNYLSQPSSMNQRIEQLCTVKMRDFKGSEVELALVKMLLNCCLSLKRIFVQENQWLDVNQRMKISKELMRFSRASAEAEMIFQPDIS